MKKNRLFILGIFTVMVALVSLSLVSGTWAKYTSSVSASDSATVAKWAWEINDKKVGTDAITFDLFGTINDTKDSNAEADVKAGLIAPGTKGSLTFVVENLSEVNALYSMHFTCAEEVAQIQYSTDNSTWVEKLSDLNITDKAIAMETGSETITIYWQWRFEVDEATNTQDTTLGMSPVTHNVSVYFSFTQVD